MIFQLLTPSWKWRDRSIQRNIGKSIRTPKQQTTKRVLEKKGEAPEPFIDTEGQFYE